MRAIGSAPDEPFSQIYVTLISAINSAESEILLTNAYFVPDPQLMKALIGAVARGVDVKLILPSTTDSSLVFHAGRSHYEPLLRGGVKLYERREALLHAKTAVIDGVWATVGSTNLDWRSFLHNQELTAVILGAEFGAKMRAAFERDLAASDPITLEAWQRRPIDDARQGNVRSTLGVLAVSIPPSSPRAARAPASPSSRSLGRADGGLGAGRGRRCARATPRCRTSSPTTSSAGRSCSSRPQTSGDLKGDVYAIVDHPFAMVQQALQSAEHWCDILILHLNVKRCRASGGTPKMLNLSVGRKFDQPIEDAYQLNFTYRVVAATRRLPAGAAERRRRPAQHQELPHPGRGGAGRRQAQRHPHVVRLRLRLRRADGDADLPGDARQPQGRLHHPRPQADGKPVYQGGVLGLLERNTMRYYLAIDAYLSAYALPAGEQAERRIREWYASTERYAEQLHEMEQNEYLEMKRKEMRRQQQG